MMRFLLRFSTTAPSKTGLIWLCRSVAMRVFRVGTSAVALPAPLPPPALRACRSVEHELPATIGLPVSYEPNGEIATRCADSSQPFPTGTTNDGSGLGSREGECVSSIESLREAPLQPPGETAEHSRQCCVVHDVLCVAVCLCVSVCACHGGRVWPGVVACSAVCATRWQGVASCVDV